MTDPFEPIRLYALDQALKSGADGADVLSYKATSLNVSILNQRQEDVEREESSGIGIRVFKDGRVAYAAGADVSEAGVRLLLNHLTATVDFVPVDSFTRLATKAELATTIPDIPLSDPLGEPALETLRNVCLNAESIGLSQKGITKSDGASAGFSANHIGLSTSHGFNGSYFKTDSGYSLSLIGGNGDDMERDDASTHGVLFAALETPDIIGQRAAQRTLDKLNPKQAKTGRYPVLFDRRVSNTILKHFIAAIQGTRLAKRTSFLNDPIGTQVFPTTLSLFEDPVKPYGLRSRPFDGEGLPVAPRTFIENGMVKNVFLDIRSADRLGLPPTGHAARGLSSPPAPSASNVWLPNGASSIAQLCRSMGEGFFVTELLGSQISLSTGDYSRGASGFWVENGDIAYPVSEVTIAGNLKDVFANLTPADDLQFVYGIDSPSLLVDGLTIAAHA